MNKSILRLCLFGLLAAGIAGTSAHLRAQDTNHPAVEKKPLHGRQSTVTPFHGNLKAVDQTAKTITVGDLTIQITSETKIDKAGKPATLQDAVVGEPASGGYTKAEDGKLMATKVHLGPKESKSHAKKNAANSESQ
jgi:uncharacterized protein YcfJ